MVGSNFQHVPCTNAVPLFILLPSYYELLTWSVSTDVRSTAAEGGPSNVIRPIRCAILLQLVTSFLFYRTLIISVRWLFGEMMSSSFTFFSLKFVFILDASV